MRLRERNLFFVSKAGGGRTTEKRILFLGSINSREENRCVFRALELHFRKDLHMKKEALHDV